MDSAQNLIDEFHSIRESYERLCSKYNEFVTDVLAVKESDHSLKEIDIHVHDDNSMSVNYMDRELLAEFRFSIDDDGNGKAKMCCYVLTGVLDAEPVLIDEFGFDAQGITDIPPKEGGDAYKINNRADAINILFHWIVLSFNEI